MSTKTNTEYQYKLQEAKRLIDTHNYLRKPCPDDTRVVYEEFVARLVAMGGTSNEMLQQVTAEDLQDVCGLPVLMARRLAEIFEPELCPFPVVGGQLAAPTEYWTDPEFRKSREKQQEEA
jgi:hypothetical protein